MFQIAGKDCNAERVLEGDTVFMNIAGISGKVLRLFPCEDGTAFVSIQPKDLSGYAINLMVCKDNETKVIK